VKIQVKLDKNTVETFFLEHTEKIVFGGVAVVLLVFLYQSATRTGFDTKPEKLQERVASASSRIDRGPDAADEQPEKKCPITPFDSIVKESQKIDSKPFEFIVTWWHPPQQKHRLRDMPPVELVKNLHGKAGRGAVLGGKAGEMAERPHGERWIMLLGKVPYKEQLADFKHCLENAAVSDPEKDVPQYIGYFVQRAEVDPKHPSDLKWTRLDYSYTAMTAARARCAPAPEVVDDKYFHSNLCFPLPTLSDRTWGEDAVDPPDIPLKSADRLTETPGSDATPATGAHAQDRQGVTTSHRGSHGAITASSTGDDGQTAASDDPLNPGGPAPGEKPLRVEPAPHADQIPTYQLFRFFDFDVKPGMQYRYRVFLILKNPNFGLPTVNLIEPEIAVPRYIGKKKETWSPDNKRLLTVEINTSYAQWSQPSAAILVPDDVEVLAGEKSPKLVNGELSGTVWVLKWLKESGIKSFKEFAAIRGKILDFPNCNFTPPVSRTAAAADSSQAGHGVRAGSSHGSRHTTGSSRPPSRSQIVDFDTSMLVVDLIGGEPLSARDKSLTRPGEVLVMDPHGNLVIHEEISDQAAFRDYKSEDSTAAAPPPPEAHGDTPHEKTSPHTGGATKSKSSAAAEFEDDDAASSHKKPAAKP
jgi:hypothetical protein